MGPKRNVAFIKPEEPNFLKKIKQEIGYKEPDTVEAKVGILYQLIIILVDIKAINAIMIIF